MADVVHCGEHGDSEETFVCSHLAKSLHTPEPLGFFFASTPRGDAWCSVCEKVRIAEGGPNGDWNDRSEAFAKITLICGGCYDKIRIINS